jgi:hypothetical protein
MSRTIRFDQGFQSTSFPLDPVRGFTGAIEHYMLSAALEGLRRQHGGMTLVRDPYQESNVLVIPHCY